MLSRFHVAQLTRTYAQLKPDGPGICSLCFKDVFTPQLRKSLAEGHNESSLIHSYSRLSRDLHASVLAGCPWCTCIGNAVLTCSDLDYWMEAWNGSGSDGGSLDEEDGDQDDSDHDEEMKDIDSQDSTGEVEDEDTESDKQAGFHSIDSLDCEAKLEIKMRFLKWNGSPLFNLVEVTIGVTTLPGDESPLQEMVGEKAVIMKLEVVREPITDLDDVIVFNRGWDIVSAASFDEWVPRAETWLQACKAHESCSPSGVFRPTRLIDVSDPEHPRLIISTEEIQHDTQVLYIALSYVWGPKQDYVLTQSGLSDMRTGLDSARLPKTLSDSIAAAHQLGFRYLWIDALCIIQDSPQDKVLELPRMADTYRESELTFIIASSAAANEGFLVPPSPENPRFLLRPFQVDPESGLTFGYRLPYKASADPISSRAWALQERVLSRRLLIFSSSGVMWMCREDFINPGAAPDAGPPYQTFLDPYLSEEHQTTTTEDNDVQAEAQIRETWTAIRADYTEMDLSYCSDKLPAISALAAEIGRKTGWTYLAGMWKENLFSELHWRCMKQNRLGERMTLKSRKVKEVGYLAPSWSWASVGIGAVVDSEDDRDDREVFGGFSILECHVDTIDPGFAYGPAKGGDLEVEGKMVELGWRYEDSPSWDGSDISLVLVGEQHDTAPGLAVACGDGSLDVLDKPLDPNMTVFCLGMSKLSLGRQRIVPVEGLILVPKGPKGSGDDAVFRRIGFFRMTAPVVFDEAATRRLVIE